MAEVEIPMAKLSDSVEQATVLNWLKRPGDTVHRGEPLVEVETDKATVVYEAEADGVLGEILVTEGATAALGEPIARLDGDGGEPRPTSVAGETGGQPRPPPGAPRLPGYRGPAARGSRSVSGTTASRRRGCARRPSRDAPRFGSASRCTASRAQAPAAGSASWTCSAPNGRPLRRRRAT